MPIKFINKEAALDRTEFCWDDLEHDEAVLDDKDSTLFVKTDDGWAAFYSGSDGVITYSLGNSWVGRKVKVTGVVYE